MSDSTLKKEFNPRDVQRIRNLITKKFDDKTAVQVGYSKAQVDRGEGDVWEENGKTWTIKNGIKQNITKLDKFKDLVLMPLTCPSCNEPMKSTSINKKMYSIHRMCLNCVVKMETELKVQGKYSEYESKMLNSNKNSIVQDLEKFLESYEQQKDTYVTEAGDVEQWSDTNNDVGKTEILKFIEKLKNTEL